MLLKKITALALLAIILAAWAVLSLAAVMESGALERAVAAACAEAAGRSCSIDRLRCEPFGGLVADGFVLAPGEQGEALLRVRSIRVRLAVRPLLAGKIEPESVVLVEPAVHISASGKEVSNIVSRLVQNGAGRPGGRIGIDIRNGTCAWDGMPLPLTAIDVALRVEGGVIALDRFAGDLAGGALRAGGRLEIERDPPLFQFHVDGRGVVCQPGLEPLMKLIGALNDYRAFQPQGPIDFRFESDPCTAFPIRGSLRLQPRGLDAMFLGYPDSESGLYDESFQYPISGVSGLVDVRVPGDVRIEEVRGSMNGGRLSIAGTVVDRGLEVERDLKIEIDDLNLDQRLFEALKLLVPKLAEYLSNLEPAGEADVAIALAGSSADGSSAGGLLPASVDLTADLAGTSMRPSASLDRIEISAGALTAAGGVCRLTGVEATCGGVAVAAGGVIGPEETLLTIRAANIAAGPELIDNLRRALPRAAEQVERLGLSGESLTVRCDYRRAAGGNEAEPGETASLAVELEGCSAAPDFFPVAIDNLRGTVFVVIEDSAVRRISFDDLAAGHAGSRLSASALWRDGALERLEVSGRTQRLTPELMEAVAGSTPAAAKYVRELKADGMVDFSLRQDGEDVVLGVIAHLKDVQSPRFPLAMAAVDGKAAWCSASGTLTLEDVFVRVGRGLISIDKGRISAEGERAAAGNALEIEAAGSGQGIRLDQNLARAFGAEALAKWRSLGIDGLVNLDDFALSLVLADQRRLESVQGTLGVTLEGASIEHPVELKNVYGRVRLAARRPVEPGFALNVQGESEHLSFAIAGKELSNVKARFELNERFLQISSLEGLLYGGYITGDEDTLRLFFASPAPFKGRMLMRGADLNRLVGRSGFALRDISGQLGWNVRFSGEMEAIGSLRAHGQVSVQNGRLWELPVLAALWGPIDGVMGIGEPPTFKEGDVRFDLQKGVMTLTEARLTSPIMNLEGTGILTPNRADVQVQFSVGPKLPIISEVLAPIWKLFKRGFMNLRVHGPYDSLSATYDPILTSPFLNRDVFESPRYPDRPKFELTGGF